MKTTVQFEGLDKASARLTKELKAVGKENSRKFIALSLKMVETQTAPYVPVDTSNLINSAYTMMTGLKGVFGFGAEYAGFVHEGGPKNWQKPGASHRFLELGVEAFIDEDLDKLLQILGE